MANEAKVYVKVTVPVAAADLVRKLRLFESADVARGVIESGDGASMTLEFEGQEWVGLSWPDTLAQAGVPFFGLHGAGENVVPELFCHVPSISRGKVLFAEATADGDVAVGLKVFNAKVDAARIASAQLFAEHYSMAREQVRRWRPMKKGSICLDFEPCYLEPCGSDGDPWDRLLGTLDVGGALHHVELIAATNDTGRLGSDEPAYATAAADDDLATMLDDVMEAMGQEKGFQLTTVQVPGVGPREYVLVVTPFDL